MWLVLNPMLCAHLDYICIVVVVVVVVVFVVVVAVVAVVLIVALHMTQAWIMRMRLFSIVLRRLPLRVGRCLVRVLLSAISLYDS
jgi:hypothetical protein